jgi:hypothetical protein
MTAFSHGKSSEPLRVSEPGFSTFGASIYKAKDKKLQDTNQSMLVWSPILEILGQIKVLSSSRRFIHIYVFSREMNMLDNSSLGSLKKKKKN